MNNACYGVTKDPNENDYLLVFDFEKVIWEYELINKLQNILNNKYGNEEIARFLYYQYKLNAEYYDDNYIRWIPFDEFKNVEYLARGGFGEVHKATWINGGYDIFKMKYVDKEVVLKRIYNN